MWQLSISMYVCMYICIRHVARIFEQGGCLRAKRVSFGRGVGAQPPAGVRGAHPPAGSRGGAPCGGLGGWSPPEIFEKYGVVHDFWQ